MEDLFYNNAQKIIIYVSLETIVDPYEKNTSKVTVGSYCVKAIVTDLIESQLDWKMPGIRTSKAKELIIEKKYKNLIKASSKILIDGEYYYGWKDNVGNKLQIREQGEYIRIYVYIKNKEND